MSFKPTPNPLVSPVKRAPTSLRDKLATTQEKAKIAKIVSEDENGLENLVRQHREYLQVKTNYL
ncbi:hypothetical protein D3C80_1944630 [compost metagenome]